MATASDPSRRRRRTTVSHSQEHTQIIPSILLIFFVSSALDTLDTIVNRLDLRPTTWQQEGASEISGRPSPLPPTVGRIKYLSCGSGCNHRSTLKETHSSKYNQRALLALINCTTLNRPHCQQDNDASNRPRTATWSPTEWSHRRQSSPEEVATTDRLVAAADKQSWRCRRGRWFGFVGQAEAIRIVRLDAPHSIEAGQSLRLRCLFENKGDKLQSLSWYKNGREFYRYQPFERRQPVLAFNMTGINVDLQKSRNHTVYLTNTTSETSGYYKCEATATTFQEANMETYVNVLAAASSAIPLVSVNAGMPLLAFVVTVFVVAISTL